MNQIEYTLLVQRILFALTGLSFFGICSTLVFINPYQSSYGIWLVLFCVFLGLNGVISLLWFWWVFAIKKQILLASQVNDILYISLITSSVSIVIISLYHTQQLNRLNFAVVLAMYILYILWNITIDESA